MTDPFFEQLKLRISGDEHALQHAADTLAGMVNRRERSVMHDEGIDMTNIEAIEESLIRQGIFIRQISLADDDWQKVTVGKILCFTKEDDTPVILSPGFRKYTYINPYTRERQTVGEQIRRYTDFFKSEAFTLTQPLPSRAMTLRDLGKLALSLLSKAEITFTIVASVGVMLLGMLTPYINKIIFSEIVPSNDISQLTPVACILFSACIGTVMLSATRSLVAFRLKDKVEYEIQSSLMMRILNVRATFFKDYSPGDLGTRVLAISTFSGQITDAALCAVLSLLVSGLLAFQMFFFGGNLLWLACLLLVAYFICVTVNFFYAFKLRSTTVEDQSKVQGLMFNMFSGIQKIKTCSAEVRVFSKWADQYSKSDFLCSPYIKHQAISSAVAYLAKVILVFVIMVAAFSKGMILSDYIAFCAVFAIAVDTVESLNNVMTVVANASPVLKLATPLLEQPTDGDSSSVIVHDISGAININGLKFHYPGSDRLIFDNFTLRINPGEYVALVGKSGCGKSTLIRLILGFEPLEDGSIFFDHYNLKDINKSSLRRNCVSTCLQDGRILNGTVMENICMAEPEASEEEAWEAARMAALDEDIRHMKDGMQTLLGDGGQQVSGGQRQRILLARAFISHPSIMVLDEATSALDNISQKTVSDNFKKLGCTRITIAHRLSTIRECDRIIVIDNGQVVEDGPFDKLLAKGGLFTELCKKQM